MPALLGGPTAWGHFGAGIRNFDHKPGGSISQEELLDLVLELNDNDDVDGILVQLPLPEQIDADAIVNAIDAAKDVDGLTPTSAGLLARGEPGLVPATPQGTLEVFEFSAKDGSGINELFNSIRQAYAAAHAKLPTPRLTRACRPHSTI